MKKNNFIVNLNILDGVITYNDFDIDPNIPFEIQKYSFKEDILQIEFGERFVLDVGYSPEFEPNGNFVIQAIQDNDWMNPISRIKCQTLDKLKKSIEKTVQLIHAKRKIKDLPYRNIEYDIYD